MPRRSLQVDMEAILDAMEDYGDAPAAYIHVGTGRVEYWSESMVSDEEPEFDPDDEQWERIPRLDPHDAHRAMERFAEQMDEDDIRDQLRVALGGRGSFGRFRAVLAPHPDLRARWEADQRADLLERALAWLHGLGIEPLYELRAAPPPPPSPHAAAPLHEGARPRIGLVDLLLLGAPEGKTELIDGQVWRRLRLASKEQARRLFAGLARELTEHEGIGWRKRFVEGRDEYSIGRYRLFVDGPHVGLDIEVPRVIWDAFTRD